MRIRDTSQQMMRSLLVIHKTHEPEVMSVHGRHLNILFRWILLYYYRINRRNIHQRYHHLPKKPSTIKQHYKTYPTIRFYFY